MRRTLAFVVVSLLSFSANAQDVLTGKEIYRINCESVVQINTNEGFGVGFITSANGIVATANHVVTTRASNFKRYATDIKVFVSGKTNPYVATAIVDQVSDDQVNYDAATLKIVASGLRPVTIGNWNEIQVGDPVFITPSYPGLGCILLDGTVSNKTSAKTAFGPKPVNVIFFQSPIRNGFSGSPIFSSRGRVVGIVDTKIWGISPALDDQRKKWEGEKANPAGQVTASFGGADLGASMLELMNNLDQNLISGLGSGVDVGYAKQEQGENKSQQH
jgi:S1-C subfamily serine protease